MSPFSYAAILGNSQKLDGGAMFGNVPKALWSKWVTPDEQNRIPLSCRALLVHDGNKLVLLETGVGAFFNPMLRARFGVEESHHVLLDSLSKLGVSEVDIDVVILSHLHFDHAGGLLSQWSESEPLRLLFPKAKYVVSKAGWERANKPHFRDKASFIPELNQLLQSSNRLMVLDNEINHVLGKPFRFKLTNGHTPGLLHTIVTLPNEAPIIFASDLIPATPWVHLPVTMGYDRAPEVLIDEKKQMLEFALENEARLFYTHDSAVAFSKVSKDENGKYKAIDCSLTP